MHQLLPLLLVFLSGLGFSLQSLIVKVLAEGGYSGVFIILLCRGFIQLLVASIFIYTNEEYRSVSLFGDTWWVKTLLFSRTFFGYLSMVICFLAIEILPVGDATVLIMLNGILVSILGVVLLGEAWRLPQMFATLICLIGAVLVARPSFIFNHFTSTPSTSTLDTIGVIYALLGALFSSIAYVCIRLLGTSAKVPWCHVVFSQAFGPILLSAPFLLITGRSLVIEHLSWSQGWGVVVAGVIGTWSQIAMTVGMQREKSATATAMRMSDILFGFIWQALFTADSVSALSVVGACLVGLSICVVVAFKKTELKEQVPTTGVAAEPGGGGGGDRGRDRGRDRDREEGVEIVEGEGSGNFDGDRHDDDNDDVCELRFGEEGERMKEIEMKGWSSAHLSTSSSSKTSIITSTATSGVGSGVYRRVDQEDTADSEV